MKTLFLALTLALSVPVIAAADGIAELGDDAAADFGRPGHGPGGPGFGPGHPGGPGFGPGWGPGRPGGPGWGPGHPGRPGWGRPPMIECVAVNLRRMPFYGRAPFQHQAEREALGACYGFGSRRCYIESCRPAYHGGGWR